MKQQRLLAQNDSNRPSTVQAEKIDSQETITKKQASDPNKPQPRQDQGGFGPMQLVLIILMVLAVFMLFRGPQKKEKQRKKMIQQLRKNDKVKTVGGIIGTVVDIKENEITLKIDESNNTKMKISASAIDRNLSGNANT